MRERIADTREAVKINQEKWVGPEGDRTYFLWISALTLYPLRHWDTTPKPPHSTSLSSLSFIFTASRVSAILSLPLSHSYGTVFSVNASFESSITKITLGKCKALWGKPRTLLRLSQRSTELSCTSFDESLWWRKIEKAKSIDEQRCGTVFFCVNLREYISPPTSSTVRVQVVGVCEIRTLAGIPGLVIMLDPACACRWERRRTLKKLYSRSQLAPS